MGAPFLFLADWPQRLTLGWELSGSLGRATHLVWIATDLLLHLLQSKEISERVFLPAATGSTAWISAVIPPYALIALAFPNSRAGRALSSLDVFTCIFGNNSDCSR